MIVLAAIAISSAWLIQQPGWAASSHFALVRALADGTPHIDRYATETGDKGWWEGHYHSNKAPGLAALSLPAYLALRNVPVIARDRDRTVWALNLWSVVLPALALFLLARYVGDVLTDGYGTIGAGALLFASLVTPFSTMFFSHVTAATIGLAAFAVLLRERNGPPSLAAVALGGLLAGLGIVFEYPLGVVAVWLFAYAIARSGMPSRAFAFAAGAVAGLAPLLVYDVWLFGSPFHLSYAEVIVRGGTTGHDVVGDNGAGFFGVAPPSLTGLLQLLGDDRGLLTLAPVTAAGAAGLVLLYRTGRRAEALTCGGIALSTLLYNAGYTPPFGGVFGGNTPGPRFLLTALPFVLVALGLAYRRAPVVVASLLAVSAVTMTVATATGPRIGSGDTGRWLTLLREGNFVDTVATEAGAADGWLSIAPYLIAVAVGLAVILAPLPLRRPLAREITAAVGVVAAWSVLAMLMPRALAAEDPGTPALAVACLVLVTSIALAVGVVAATAGDPVPGGKR